MSRIRADVDPVARSYPAIALTGAFAALLALAAFTHSYAVAGVVLLAQLIIATAPPPYGESGRPLRSSRLVPVGLGSLVATTLTVVPDLFVGAAGTTPSGADMVDTGMLAGVAAGCAIVVVSALLAQMVRTDGRVDLVASLSDTVSLGVLATFLCGWVATAVALDGRTVIVLSAVALFITAALWAIPGSRWMLGGVAVGVSAAACAGGSIYVSSSMSPGVGTALGAAIGLLGWLGRAIAAQWRPCAALRWGIEGVIPAAVVGPVVFVVGQLNGI